METNIKKITLGGASGTGKGTVSTVLAEKLQFDLMSAGNFVREIIAERGVDILTYNQEKNKDPDAEEREIDDRTAEYGRNNENFIFEGHVASFFIPDAFKILLLCDEDKRMERIAQRQNISVEEARTETLGREQLQKDNYKRVYDIENHVDPAHYDLVIDTTEKTPEEIIEIIMKKVTNDIE